jgi:hypothetical protein
MVVKRILSWPSKVPGHVVIVDRKLHAWYLVEPRTRVAADYGRTDGTRAGAYLDYRKEN